MKPLRAVVVEDVPSARLHLRRLLEDQTGVTWVGEAAHGREAVSVCARLEPDLVFLDIELPGISGLEVAKRLDPDIRVIFTTAYDQHAVAAFELEALDYLLKPFTAARLKAALTRAQGDKSRRRIDDESEGPVRDRVYVRARGRIVPVELSRVDLLQADGDYVVLWEDQQSHLVRVSLSQLMDQIDATHFIRIHRSHAINLRLVSAFRPLPDGRLAVELRSGRRVTSSRARTPELRERLRL